jgi:hypothetical protein
MYQLSSIARASAPRANLPGLAVPKVRLDPANPAPAATPPPADPANPGAPATQPNEPPSNQPPAATPTPARSAPAATPTRATAGLVAIPNVFGLPEAEAQRRIRAAGLATARPIYQRQKDMPPNVNINIVPVGAVLSATPTYGTMVEKGTVVTIAVRARE